jgi:hypothetical protein
MLLKWQGSYSVYFGLEKTIARFYGPIIEEDCSI